MAETILLLLLENSILFSVLFGGIWLLKRIFRMGMSARLHYLIWVVVVIKLLVPFSVSVPWSPGVLLAEAAQQWPQETVEKAAFNTQTPDIEPNDMTVQSGDTQERSLALPAQFDWTSAVLYLWLGGTAAYMVWLGIKWSQLRKAIRRSRLAVPEHMSQVFLCCKKAIGIRKEVCVMMQDVLHVPAATGLVHPVVLIPAHCAQNTERLEHVFMHELMHIKRSDIAVIWGLNILRALYWFNPLVWVCFQRIQRDMEADCDSMALAAMGTHKLSDYIDTILYFSKKDRPVSLQAAMSLNDGCTQMKHRIRSMFLKKKTKAPVKAAVLCLAMAMVTAAFTSGCVLATERSQAGNRYVNVGHFTAEDFSSGSVTIRIDAQVLKPDEDTFSVYETKRVGFSQEQIDKVLRYFYGNKTLYSSGAAIERKANEIRLDYLEKQYDETALIEVEQEAQWLRSYLDQLPEDQNLTISDGQLVDGKVQGWVDLGGGKQGSFYVVNAIDDLGVNPCIQISAGYGIYFDPCSPFDRQADGISLTPDQAIRKVSDMLAEMGFDDVEPAYIYACNVVSDVTGEYIEELPGGYDVRCIRSVDGMTAGYAHKNMDDFVTDESIDVFVDDTGIVRFEWLNHWENGAATENVSLLPLEDIERIFTETMTQTYQNSSNKMEKTVNKMTLELARVNDGSEWKLVPAWSFYATSRFWDEGEVVTSNHASARLMTINAVDGTVIG